MSDIILFLPAIPDSPAPSTTPSHPPHHPGTPARAHREPDLATIESALVAQLLVANFHDGSRAFLNHAR
ncbi:hypothetical protein ABT263_29280 [Kitasatospora sp. NPDC001603]|uniref:hypothetical protein n=1 Tax=Kitasatospora sp. NPDC001603 TaxID=3154388 RepID=UPI003330344B